MRRSFKVKGDAARVALVEFLVDKRVRFLEYLRELHRDEVLWMGTVRLTRQDVVRSFRGDGRVEQSCTEYRLPSGDPTEVGEPSHAGEAGAAVAATTTTTTLSSSEDVVVTLDPIAGVPHRVGSSWLSSHMPCYLCLAMSLGDLLQAPLPAFDFVECMYTLLLEMDVRFATGAAAKALAQRNLRNYRQQQLWLSDPSSAAGGGGGGSNSSSTATGTLGGVAAPFLPTSWDNDSPMKYFYLNLEHNAYTTAGGVRYEELIIPLCSQLTLAYRRLGEYDVTSNDEGLRRILSIDRRLQHMFFSVVSKELGKIARGKLLQQTLLLSTDGLFAGICNTHGNTQSLLKDLIRQPASTSASAPSRAPKGGVSNISNSLSGMHDTPMVDSDEEFDEEDL